MAFDTMPATFDGLQVRSRVEFPRATAGFREFPVATSALKFTFGCPSKVVKPAFYESIPRPLLECPNNPGILPILSLRLKRS